MNIHFPQLLLHFLCYVKCAAKWKREYTHCPFTTVSYSLMHSFDMLLNGAFNSISTTFPPRFGIPLLSFLLFLSLSGLHWYFINFYSCISRIWSIQFSHKVSEVSAFSRFSLTLRTLSHSLFLLSNALRDAFPDGQCWKLITLQLDFLPSHKWKWMQVVAGTKVVLPVLSSSSSSMYRQLVCPLPQPMRPQLTQLFNWIEAINTQSETETKPEIAIALEGHVVS